MGLYLVTGGAGFIGSSIARALIGRGDAVRIIDNFSTGKRENLADIIDRVELVEGDIRDDVALAKATAGVEVIFHEAAIRVGAGVHGGALENHAVNATGTMRVLESARRAGVRRVVYAASSAAYGDEPGLPKVETMRPARSRPTARRSWRARWRCRSTRAPSASRPSACATSTCSARARTRSPSTRR